VKFECPITFFFLGEHSNLINVNQGVDKRKKRRRWCFQITLLTSTWFLPHAIDCFNARYLSLVVFRNYGFVRLFAVKKNTQIVTTLIKVRRLKPRLKPTSTDWATRRENSLRGPVMGPRRFRSIFCEPNYVSLVWIGCVFRGLIVPRSHILEPSVSTRLEH